MFVGLRELRFARGRFVLIGAVVALITLLVGFLSGLTGGLAAQNVSAVLALPGDRIVLAQPDDGGQPSFADPELDAKTVRAWQNAAGVTSAVPIGISQARATLGDTTDSTAKSSEAANSSSETGVALFGVPAATAGTANGDAAAGGGAASGAKSTAGANALQALAPTHDDEVGLSAGAAKDLGAKTGDTVTITGKTYTVASVGGSSGAGAGLAESSGTATLAGVTGAASGDLWYSHTPVITMTPDAWSAAAKRMGGSGQTTLLAVSGTPDWNAVGGTTDTVAKSPLQSLTALETFKSEIGSLGLMMALLFGISALVVGAFFTVWTMQRAGDVAVLKALGSTTAALVRDSLGQAAIVLVAGIGVGLAIVVGLGTLAGQALPFMLNAFTTVAPAGVMAILGLAGAAFALRSVTRADPLTALGSNR